MFQSLIGTLQTGLAQNQTRPDRLFQSLIGTLQTRISKRSFNKIKEFQSLIGTLQTFAKNKKMTLIKLVSIPYRYATNAYENVSVFWFISLFQSLIGTLQTRITSRYSVRRTRFNPLQVRYKREVTIQELWERAVSIPYRYATNPHLARKLSQDVVCFNPLQVRYKHTYYAIKSRCGQSFNPLQVRYKRLTVHRWQ